MQSRIEHNPRIEEEKHLWQMTSYAEYILAILMISEGTKRIAARIIEMEKFTDMSSQASQSSLLINNSSPSTSQSSSKPRTNGPTSLLDTVTARRPTWSTRSKKGDCHQPTTEVVCSSANFFSGIWIWILQIRHRGNFDYYILKYGEFSQLC